MKDLYAKLGIEPTASAEEVSAALQRNPGLSDYSAILQSPGKRAIYDGTHATVKAIGTLRYRLGLDAGPSWFLENYPDFAPGLKAVARAARAAAEPAQAPARQARVVQAREEVKAKPVRGRKWLVPVAASIVAAIVLVLFLTRL